MGVPPQHLMRDGVEGAAPDAAGVGVHRLRARQHLPRGPAGERQQEDPVRLDPGGDEPGDAGRQRRRLARARTGEHA
jgi:hypothetical protein